MGRILDGKEKGEFVLNENFIWQITPEQKIYKTLSFWPFMLDVSSNPSNKTKEIFRFIV